MIYKERQQVNRLSNDYSKPSDQKIKHTKAEGVGGLNWSNELFWNILSVWYPKNI